MKGSRALFVSSLLLIAASGIVLARSSPVGSPHAPNLLPFIIGPAPFAGINLPGLWPPGISPECKFDGEKTIFGRDVSQNSNAMIKSEINYRIERPSNSGVQNLNRYAMD
uniref:Uncharacterized protein n=1 Tax=Populus alba TaxID=43335 RepID=A0A4U5MBK8_POPAL|nr:hypothetical protein D5086_0000311880 [Populus alba]